MKLSLSKLPTSQKYICYPKILKNNFKEFEELHISMGFIRKNFEFDSRCLNRPNIEGIIVCSLSVSRKLTLIMSFYPITDDKELNLLSEKFVNKYIPLLRNWLESQLKKSETQILGHEEMLIELFDNDFKTHKLKFL